MSSRFVVIATYIHAPVCGEVEIHEQALIEVNNQGRIEKLVQREDDGYESLKSRAKQSGRLVELGSGQYLLPGLVDLHIHAPQWPQMGKALHLSLSDWLQGCTFPLEAKYADLEFANEVYTSLVNTLLANGTTTAVYFATIHLAASKALSDICLENGQRALVGKVAMDNATECPEYYRDSSTVQGLDETRALIEYIRSMPGNDDARVMPIVTPRFIPSCSDEMLTGLAKLAKEHNCHIQTHCSESDWEHAYVLDRHGVSDTTSLDNFGLLTDKTVLAHSNLLSDVDMDTIVRKESGIAHCPLSNAYFSNSVFPARKALDRQMAVGLGTDISGGANPSLLHNCSAAVTASRVLEDGVNGRLPADERGTPGARIDFKEAFWMATTGGAQALGLNIGKFSLGYEFDAIVVDSTVADSNLILWEEFDTHEDSLQKIINNADRHNITKVWVQGDLVRNTLA